MKVLRIASRPGFREPSPEGLGPARFDPSRWSQEDIDAEMFRDCDNDDDFDECHMGPDGLCGAAGSEWCDFECPTMREFRRRG